MAEVQIAFTTDSLRRDDCEAYAEELEDITKEQLIGSGVQGRVSEICLFADDPIDGCDNVVKEFTGRNQYGAYIGLKGWEKEVALTLALNKNPRFNGKVPRLLDAWSCGNKGFMIMQRLSGPTLGEIIDSGLTATKGDGKPFGSKDIRRLAQLVVDLHTPEYDEDLEMYGDSYHHQDLHASNVMWDDKAGNFNVIDFGLADEYYIDDLDDEERHKNLASDQKRLLQSIRAYRKGKEESEGSAEVNQAIDILTMLLEKQWKKMKVGAWA